MNMYLPSEKHAKSSVPGGQLLDDLSSKLAPAYFALAQHDPLYDGGLAFAKKLSESGVKVEIERGEGLTHGYLHAMGYCPEAEDILRKIAVWLGRHP